MIELQGNLRRLGGEIVVRDLIAAIDTALAPRLKRYFDYRKLSSNPNQKAIKDCVWGMIDLSSEEVVLLDSPVLQRLRRIKQLGLSYVTYPTAGYSRFEHTLGVVNQAERLFNAVIQRSGQRIDSKDDRRSLRLAALLHDIGHGPLSHVSENYYTVAECNETTLLAQADSLKESFKVILKVPNPKLSECLSVIVSMTACVRELLDHAGYGQQHYSTAIPLIVGLPPSTERAFLGQLLSNVIDADKLDYMFRDAMFSGVPLPVDLERLLYKLFVRECPPAEVPDLVGHFEASPVPAYVLATDIAGNQHARDLSYARNLLYERVYGHHKTRAAERLALKLLGQRRYALSEFVIADDSSLLTPQPGDSDLIKDLCQQLADRTLPHRVFTVQYEAQMEMSTEWDGREAAAVTFKENQIYGWQKMQGAFEQFEGRQNFIDELKTQLVEMGVDLSHKEVWIDPTRDMKAPPITLLVFAPDGSRVDEYFRGEAASHPQSRFAAGHIYQSGFEQRDVVALYIAIEKVFVSKFKLYFDRRAADYSKVNWRDVREKKQAYEQAAPNFFAGCGLLRPQSAKARTVDATTSISALATKFSEFNLCQVDGDRIRAFLDQFPEDLVEPMLFSLADLRFFTRADIRQALIGLQLPERCILVPLAKGLQKSSSLLGYYSADLPQGQQMMSLDDALADHGQIVFVEDCIISGKQPKSVLQTWCGHTPDCNEQGLGDGLDLNLTALRQRAPLFRFIAGTQAGLDSFTEVARDLRFGENIAAAEIVAPWVTTSPLRSFLAEVGEALLKSVKQPTDAVKWTDQLCRERALGYTGDGLRLAFAHNVPTGTVTALWCKGTFNGAPWLPLFERRDNRQAPETASNTSTS